MAKKKVVVDKTSLSKKKVTPKKEPLKKAIVKKKTVKKVSVKKAATKSKPSKASVGNKVVKIKSELQLLVDASVEGILEVKGNNIAILDLRKIKNRVCEFYIICQADSKTQVNAIAGSVESMVKKRTGENPYHTEGTQNSEWVLVDYVTVAVHIFQTEARYFYNLETLWADAEITKIVND